MYFPMFNSWTLAWFEIILIVVGKAEIAFNNWSCADGIQTISEHYRCDGFVDCNDRSDEGIANGCESRGCYLYEFTCDNNECITEGLVCNGENDCGGGDNSDERDCEKPIVLGDRAEFVSCPDGTRIPSHYLCDGEVDCGDSSDESNCGDDYGYECDENELRCNNTDECILPHWICDGDRDCQDFEDEKNCHAKQAKQSESTTADPTSVKKSCAIDEFPCHENCLKISKACDGVFDCPDGSDESYLCHVNTCRLRNNATLWPDFSQKKSHLLVCDQACASTPVGPRCYCFAGYSLADNGYTCRISGGSFGNLFFSADDEIRSRGMDDLLSTRYDAVVNDTNSNASIVSLDYDFVTDSLVWGDSDASVIQTFHNHWNSPKTFLRVAGLTSATLDWLLRNIYIAYFPPTSTSSRIGVVTFPEHFDERSGNSTVICDIITNLNKPISLTIYFQKRKLLFVDQEITSNASKILMSNLDGTSQSDITRSQNSINCIEVDQNTGVLYWSESNQDGGSIHMMSLDSKELKVLLASDFDYADVQYPFALAVFEDVLYYTDQGTKEIWAVDSVTGKFVFDDRLHKALIKTPGTKNLLALAVAYPKSQLKKIEGDSECQSKGCSHVCVLRPFGSICLCPESYELARNGKECVPPLRDDIPASTTAIKMVSSNTTATSLLSEAKQTTTFANVAQATITTTTTAIWTTEIEVEDASQSTSTLSNTTSSLETSPKLKSETLYAYFKACAKPINSLINSYIVNRLSVSVYPIGHVLHLKCRDGWHVIGELAHFDYFLTCDENGLWMPADKQQCIPYICPDLNCGQHGICVALPSTNNAVCKCDDGKITMSTCSSSSFKENNTLSTNTSSITLPSTSDTKYLLIAKIIGIALSTIIIFSIFIFLFVKYYGRSSSGRNLNFHYRPGKPKEAQIIRLATIKEEDEKKIKGNNNSFGNPNYTSPHINKKKGYNNMATKITGSRDSGYDRSSSSGSDDCSNSDPSKSEENIEQCNTIEVADSDEEYIGSVEVLEDSPPPHVSVRNKFSNWFYIRKTESREHMITSP